jgi:hypothetical protein
MSQWGSQRWADLQGRRWPWIVDHYYNASGAGGGLRTSILSSPLRIDAVSPQPTTAFAGGSLQLQFNLFNLAAQTHAPVFLGASLFRSGQGYVSDPPNDAGVSVATGASLHTRDFDLPADLASGSYDLLVALYLDIDANGAINSGDFALVSESVPDAVIILAAVDAVFSDGFESP